MFLINKEKNEATSITKKSFQELKFRERQHLQEWICKNTDILGERLLIIQKEFSGFDDTNERLDLLALDETGNLVIIENKLDDSGKDVVWQSLKYASYCSSLSKSDITDIFQKYLNNNDIQLLAEDKICEFLEIDDFGEVELNHEDQRLIMVAANFRKEVTSTAMWLLDHNIKLKCIKVTPYELNDQILLDTEQIIPVVDAKEYQIKIAQKKQEEFNVKEVKHTRHVIRLDFWSKLLEQMNSRSSLFANVNPSKDNWLGCGSGYSGISYSFVITKEYCRVELFINIGDKENNKALFDKLYSRKTEIENTFEHSLDWQRLDDKKSCRISYRMDGVNVFNENEWPKMINFLTNHMIKLEKTFKVILSEVMR
ncbi:MAG: DUF4268 domain-containing protein [Alkalibacterium sp.]|nr:DUF4268 domain-containing protein [Alkalibacterium sp.]